jgi:ubiquinone/menaquinone biosynthesis C-methylase UbiE
VSTPIDEPEARKRAIAGVFDRGAGTYDQVGVDFFTPAGRDLVARARLRPGDRILDVGCGRGAVLFAAAEAVGPSGRAVGVDVSSQMAGLTAAEARSRGLTNTTVAQGDAEHLDFPRGAFDAVFGGFVLFFLPDPRAALTHFAALLEPAGRLAFTTFAAQDPTFDAAMRAVGRFVPGGMPERGDRQGPFGSADGITTLLSANGFADVTITEATYVSRFADPDHWLAWTWSHGGRATLERVPDCEMDAATEAAKAELEQARTAAGDYLLRTRVRFTIARPAPGS